MQNLVLPVIRAALSFNQMSFGRLQGVIDSNAELDVISKTNPAKLLGLN
jgi:hypothetical protein